jgi:hypothetical protein
MWCGSFLALAGCGWYTNLPAEIRLVGIEPSTVTIKYTKVVSAQGGTSYNVDYTQPVVTLQGAPGSIGVTYDTASLIYYAPSKDTNPPAAIDALKIGSMFTSVRINSSALREDPAAGNQDVTNYDQKKIILGTTKWTAPVVTKDLIDYGAPDKGNPKLVVAELVLSGKDDARWPASAKTIDVPVAFAVSVE